MVFLPLSEIPHDSTSYAILQQLLMLKIGMAVCVTTSFSRCLSVDPLQQLHEISGDPSATAWAQETLTQKLLLQPCLATKSAEAPRDRTSIEALGDPVTSLSQECLGIKLSLSKLGLPPSSGSVKERSQKCNGPPSNECSMFCRAVNAVSCFPFNEAAVGAYPMHHRANKFYAGCGTGSPLAASTDARKLGHLSWSSLACGAL